MENAKNRWERGMTLIEMLVVVAILSLVMTGIYGMLNAAYQSYMDSRRRIESQQTARVALDYVVFRLREIDGGRNTDMPWDCLKCHTAGRAADDDNAKSNIPCPEDVSVPRSILEFELGKATLSAIDAKWNVPTQAAMEYNQIKFKADLLPIFGFSESFTDAGSTWKGTNTKDEWDWKSISGDLNGNTKYDDGEFELLEDLNENNMFDYYGENWELKLIKESDKPFYSLVESMDFSSLRPAKKGPHGKWLYNRSDYPDEGYGHDSDNPVVIATGIVRLNIRRVERYSAAQLESDSTPGNGEAVRSRCRDTDGTACHGSKATNPKDNVYEDAAKFSLKQFAATHENWNVRGFVVEITTAASKAGKTRLTTMQQFVIPRNIEINK